MSSTSGERLRDRIIELEKILEEKEENVVEYLVKIEQLEDYIRELQNRIPDRQESTTKTTLEEDLSEKERILNLLKSEALTSKEIAKRQNLTEQDTRTYLLRLKNEDRIRVNEKIGRYNIYTYKAPTYSGNSHIYSHTLEYELSYLINLMEMKMILKEGIDFSQSDLLTIKRIKQRITQKKEDLTKGL
jgi:DNA-binding CsgD family transcriptional regulator